ncbi:MAG TPA: S8 family serine peptidase [Tepidisphaeraceae bacterium]|jgi:subtilisin family serine protease
MSKRPHRQSPAPRIEPLELRTLLATTPWGAFPQLIDQDLAVANYGQYNGSGQTIAIIDTGVDYNHPAIKGKYIGGVDLVTGDGDPMDEDGHGTGVAAIAVGNQFTFGGAKYQGVAPGARIVVVRVDNDKNVPDSRYEQAFQWIIDNRQKYNITVVNASFGSGHYATEAQRSVYADEMAQLASDGVVIVAASGNDGAFTPYGVEYPGADPSAFAVGSINSSDAISKFTERGPNMDILAPGENVPTAYLDYTTHDPIYLEASGTSFSAPFIAGAAAILKQIDPTFTARDVMSILRGSGSDNFDGDKEANPYTQLSWPRLDLDSAISLALQRKGGQPSASQIGVEGRENAIKFDRDGVLYYAWYNADDHHLRFATRNADGDWSATRVIDSGSDVGHFVSLAITSTGKPAMAYYDSYNADLKYAEWNGSGWSVKTVDSGRSTGLYPSLAFDQYDDPIITYYYKTSGDLRMAIDDGTGWRVSTIDSTQDSGRYSSFAISNTGQWSVAYENTTTGQFKFARRGSSGWNVQTADSRTRIGGGFISLAYDGSNQPSMSYYDAYNADLKFAHFNGSSWTAETVASNLSQGLYTNLYLDSAGDADILYYSKSADAVFRATGHIGNWSVGALVADGGRHVYYARYGNSERFFSYYQPASDNLVVDSF